MGLSELRLIAHPGAGLLARTRGSVLFLADAGDAAAAELLAKFKSASGQELVDGLFKVVEFHGAAEVKPFCLLTEERGSVQLVIHGSLVVAALVGAQPRTLAGATAASRLEQALGPDVRGVRVGQNGQPSVADALLDLVEGVQPAGGFELAPRVPVAPEPAKADDPGATQFGVPPPAVDAARKQLKQAMTKAFQAMGTAPEQQPPPEIEGALCASEHLNNPASERCWICGEKVGKATSRGPRPPLGRVTTRENRSWILDGDFILGRQPERSDDVQAGRARPIVVPAEHSGVSRLHAAIRLDGWTILVQDLGSSNGTFVLTPGRKDWQRIDPANPLPVASGTVVTLGGYELVVESL